MGANAAWRVMGFVLRVSSWLLFGLFRERLENRVLGRTLVDSGCWTSFLMGIFAFKSAKVEVWFQLECAPEQLVSVVTTNRHLYVATFFLWYPNLIICYLNMLYFRMIWTFAFGKCYSRGALKRFLVVLILIETRAVLIMKVSPGVIFSCAGFSTFAYFGFLF